MAKVQVPRQELAELVGLAPDVDDETLEAAIEKALAKINAEHQAARPRPAAAILPSLMAAATRRRAAAAHTKKVLGSLAPALPPAPAGSSTRVVDSDAERGHDRVMASLKSHGYQGDRQAGAGVGAVVAVDDALVGPMV